MNTVHPGNKKKGTGTVLTYIFTRDQGKIISTTEKVSKPRDTSLFGFGYSSKTNKPTLQGSAAVSKPRDRVSLVSDIVVKLMNLLFKVLQLFSGAAPLPSRTSHTIP